MPYKESPSSGGLPGSHASDSLSELRDLLIGREKEKLDRIEKRLDNPAEQVKNLSRNLPEAILLGAARNEKLAKALGPTLDQSIKSSVKKNPKALADAIFPILGPGIRKAIVSTLMGMIQSLNQVLNYSLSIKGLKWRFEAFRSGKSFAEVVLLHTLVYRVEQIFLIHKNTGLVLQHVESKEAVSQDPDLVSGMLTAIQDFISDSFHSDTGAALDTLRMGGDLNVWIEQGPHAILAAVIRGTPPLKFREDLRELTDTIHLIHGDTIASFDGDVAPFEVLTDSIADYLQSQMNEEKTRISPLLWIFFIGMVLLAAAWMVHTWRNHVQWGNFLSELNAQNGIVVAQSGRNSDGYFLSGLKDPLSPDPVAIMRAAGIPPEKVHMEWKPYAATDPEIVLKRAQKKLVLPTGITLHFSNGTLSAAGDADHPWIEKFHQLALTLPGVTAINDRDLIDTDLYKLQTQRKTIEQMKIFFPLGQADFTSGQESRLDMLLKTVREIQHLENIFKTPVRIIIIGSTDASGSEQLNKQLSRERAETVYRFLIEHDVHPANITPFGSAATRPKGSGEQENIDLHRNVSFKTFFNPPE